MSVAIRTVISRDTASPAVRARIAALTPQRLSAAIGPAVATLVREHLRGLGQNKRGWPTTHFYARAARAVSWIAESLGALISITLLGIRQRFHGGHIAPVIARALAIPINPVAAGHVPKDFPGLFLMQTKTGAYLVQAQGAGESGGKGFIGRMRSMGGHAARRIRASLNFLFVLKAGVDQAPDPNVLPSRASILSTAIASILRA